MPPDAGRMVEQPPVVRMVAWALHMWDCPICLEAENDAALGKPGDLGHVTWGDVLLAQHLVITLNLTPTTEELGRMA